MGAFGWSDLVALLTSIGFGTASAVFPLANAETYVVASQVSAVAGIVPIAIGVALGQSVGKLLLFLGVRRGREFRIMQRRRQKTDGPSTGPVRMRLRAWIGWLLALIGRPRWGLPIVGMAAVVGIPPLYAVALLAGATKMRAVWFFLVAATGRIARFLIVALGIGGLAQWLILAS
jgi:membrane protein YqaA with SNARE-associated domain